jgi:hypothetical protein
MFAQVALSVTQDQQVSGTSLTGITELSCPVQPQDKCYFNFFVLFQQSLLTASMKLDLLFPSSPLSIVYNIIIPASSGIADVILVSSNRACIGGALIAASTDYLAQISGVLINGSNAGILQPQFSSSALGTVTVKAGSSGVMTNL